MNMLDQCVHGVALSLFCAQCPGTGRAAAPPSLRDETFQDALQQLNDLHGALQREDRIAPLDVRFHRLHATICALAGLAPPTLHCNICQGRVRFDHLPTERSEVQSLDLERAIAIKDGAAAPSSAPAPTDGSLDHIWEVVVAHTRPCNVVGAECPCPRHALHAAITLARAASSETPSGPVTDALEEIRGSLAGFEREHITMGGDTVDANAVAELLLEIDGWTVRAMRLCSGRSPSSEGK